MCLFLFVLFFFSSRRRHTRCALVTGVQTCALPILAVPGSPHDPRAQGCNLLIREGATLIQTVDDVLEAVGPIDARMVREPVRRYAAAPTPMDASDGERRSLIDLLGPTPVAVDALVRQSGQAASTVQLLLLDLELAGRVERHAGAQISLV